MGFELTKIDPYNCSLEELEKEIKQLEKIKDEYFNLEQSIKIWINSCYGALGSPWFECYNMSVAEAVTLQGQDLIKYANKKLDEYFLNLWHNDKELHEELGITYANKIAEKSLIIYNDTDSLYLTFEPVVKSCDYKGDMIDFILKIKEFRLTGYLKKCFNEYAEKFNTKNYQDLELEKISYSALMVAKKKYILDLAWKDPGVRFKPQAKIKSVGIEIMQGSTPPFARTTLKTLLHTLFSEGKELKYAEVVKTLKYIKQQFVLQDPNDISKTVAIGDYEKYVLEDKKELKLADKCPINVRASGIYNHKLLNNRFKSKYNLIKTGDKIKYYYAKASKDENAFGFLPNLFPYEFAPEIDYDLQFAKVVIEPFNRYMMAAGFNAIPQNLIYSKSLF